MDYTLYLPSRGLALSLVTDYWGSRRTSVLFCLEFSSENEGLISRQWRITLNLASYVQVLMDARGHVDMYYT